jgi:anti-anti-sigma regulatory factor
MPATLEQQPDRWLIRLEGETTFAGAAELKELLLPWILSGANLEWDLAGVTEIDCAILQLLWASGLEATRLGRKVTGWASAAAWKEIQDAGFSECPGFPVRELKRGQGEA